MSASATTADIAGPPLHKGFVTVEGNRVHYIRQGSGPALVLLHASPCSAKVMGELQAVWGHEFTTFAFDLPGFGLSQAPVEGEITIERLADLIAGAMRAIDIRQAGLYGRHTGASVALELALRHPDLAAMILTDGLPIFSAPYTEERLAQYLPAITPEWHGGHLTWTFFRYREQHMFWPWDAGDIAHRADADLPDIDFLHRGTVELLEAAETYARTYRAAFVHRALPRIADVIVPAFWGNRPGDSQYKTIPLYPEGAPVRTMSRDSSAAMLEELDLLRLHRAVDGVPAHRSAFAAPNLAGEVYDYIDTRHGPVRALGLNLHHSNTPLLFLHDLPGSLDLHLGAIETLAMDHPVLAFDLAGNAESPSAAPGLDLWCDQIVDVLDTLGWTQVEIHAEGTAAALALHFARHHPARMSGMVLNSPPLLTSEERAAFMRHIPDIVPSEDGGYLLRLWHHQRDQQLWFPWFDHSHTARRTSTPNIDPAHLTRRAIALLKQPRNYGPIWRTVLACDLLSELASAAVPVTVTSDPDDIFAPTVRRQETGQLGAAKH
ncbi:Pimeloyl-ACP methyl ester carboxylesterase [Devosia lucknowensis]|uniref:Pimeloyl-ACP methyl ester carboxylesterase n=1 Tax=Devosia lucknowensis TaxID=1096929 RepID=A0A1Y6GB71_9HYPH|nr:alpha/beta hydrolase [Devosia lucknowensis]SMQ85697.1 Pimeloyl-ACP methyl ester carboxylesterase [Devosia lucknowensis]